MKKILLGILLLSGDVLGSDFNLKYSQAKQAEARAASIRARE